MTAGSALRTQPRSAPVRVRPPESHAGGASGEQAPEERKGRRRVDATDEPLLVRRQGRGGEAEVQADGRCTGGPRPGGCPVGVRLDGDGRGRGARGDGSADTERRNAKHRRRATPVGHERKRTNYMPRGPRARHRAGAPGASGLPFHAGRGRERSGVRGTTTDRAPRFATGIWFRLRRVGECADNMFSAALCRGLIEASLRRSTPIWIRTEGISKRFWRRSRTCRRRTTIGCRIKPASGRSRPYPRTPPAGTESRA